MVHEMAPKIEKKVKDEKRVKKGMSEKKGTNANHEKKQDEQKHDEQQQRRMSPQPASEVRVEKAKQITGVISQILGKKVEIRALQVELQKNMNNLEEQEFPVWVLMREVTSMKDTMRTCARLRGTYTGS